MKYLFYIIGIAVLGTVSFVFIQSHQISTPPTSEQVLPVPQTQNSASLKEKVGQMLIVGFRGTKISSDSPIVHVINDLNLGGVILFDYDSPSASYGRNIVNKTQVTTLVASLKDLTNRHIFVSVDLEGGAVNRLKGKYGFTNFPSALTLGKAGNLTATENDASKIGAELAGVGFNMDFAPDVDVNVNPKNPVIGGVGRSFSSDPEQVVLEAKAFIDGLHSQNIISVIKHFPGHGSSTSDSHLGFADITKTYQEKELIPFKELENSTDAIMVAHVTNTQIDQNYPASLSPLFIQNILRGELGYTGVVISDDMSMGAIVKNYTLEDAVVRAVNAGNDMLIVSNNGILPYDENLPDMVSGIIIKAVQDGKIPERTINAAYAKIEKLKSDYKI